MTHILNSRDSFRADFIAGYVAAEPSIEQVPDTAAVMRAGGAPPGTVPIIVGGGSGHFPAFAGFVGEGMATAAVIGEVFASPSAEQVRRTIAAVDNGSGVLLCIANYGGDVMNFAKAAKRAERDGTRVRSVVFTDDVASAEPGSEASRRGIAGGFFVLRALGAAAAAGRSLDDVAAVGVHANGLTRTLGVAFGGCVLPGSDEPHFVVEPSTMGIGLGIHGEPGVGEGPLVPADELAELLVERLLADLPAPAGVSSCAVLLNGLGATSGEELYVLHGSIDAHLRRRGVEPAAVHVGEVVTSLGMPGCSLSICWIDDELRPLLAHPVSTPGVTVPASP